MSLIQNLDLARQSMAAIRAGGGTRVQITPGKPSEQSLRVTAAAKLREAASARQTAEVHKASQIESNNLYLPNVANISKADAATLKDVVRNYAADNSTRTMQVYGANGSEKTNSLAAYSAWLDKFI